ELRRYDRSVGAYEPTVRVSQDSSQLALIDTYGTLIVLREPCSRAHGDLTHDCSTDLADLVVLLSSFGTCEPEPAFNPIADIDDSGCVDLSDLNALLAGFGQ